jgi:hypothetical protein
VVTEVLTEAARGGVDLPSGFANRVANAIGARARLGEQRDVRAALLRALANARRL